MTSIYFIMALAPKTNYIISYKQCFSLESLQKERYNLCVIAWSNAMRWQPYQPTNGE